MSQATEQMIIDELKTLVEPQSYRVLVKVNTPENKTAGGIYLAGATLEKEHNAADTGVVLSMGSAAYKDARLVPDGNPSIKVGDTVCFGRYSGRVMKFKDKSNPDNYSNTVLVRILNDEDLDLKYTPKPESFLELLEVR